MSDLSASIRNTIPRLQVNVEVPHGRTLAVMGANGAGKSTLLNMISGVLGSEAGTTITLGGRTLVGSGTFVPPHKRRVALLAQDAGLFPHMTVRHNIAFAPRALGVARSDVRKRVDRLLEITDTTDLADRRPHQLSGGQAQRVAIARALAAEPELLLLDEPFRALDVDVATRIRSLLRKVLAQRDQTTMFVTHDIIDTVTLADSVLVLSHGEVTERGTVREVLDAPQSTFTARLSGLNLISGTWQGSTMTSRVGAISGDNVDNVSDGTECLAIFAPSEVSVFTEAVAHGSPRNILTATVVRIEPHHDQARVRCTSAGVPIAADITWQSITALSITAGDTVYLTVKKGDIRVYSKR